MFKRGEEQRRAGGERSLPRTEVMLRRLRMNSGVGVSVVDILERASIVAGGQGRTLDEVLYRWVRSREGFSIAEYSDARERH